MSGRVKHFIRFDAIMFSTHSASRAITQPHNSEAGKEIAMKFFFFFVRHKILAALLESGIDNCVMFDQNRLRRGSRGSSLTRFVSLYQFLPSLTFRKLMASENKNNNNNKKKIIKKKFQEIDNVTKFRTLNCLFGCVGYQSCKHVSSARLICIWAVLKLSSSSNGHDQHI